MNPKEIVLGRALRLCELAQMLLEWAMATTAFYVVWQILRISAILAVFAGVASADYTQNRWVGQLTNTRPEAQRKRVSMFAAVVDVGATTYVWRTAGATVNSPTISTARRVYLNRHTGNGGSGTIFSSTRLADTVANTSTAYVIPSLDRETAHSTSVWYTTNVNDSTLAQQFGGAAQQNSTLVSVPGTTTTTRGALLHQYEFEMAPHSSMALNLEHTGPFFVVVEDYKEFLTPDGGTTYGYEEVDEHTSTLATIVDPATTAPAPENIVDAPDVEYTAGETAAPAARVAAVTELEHLDTNDEARHTDTMGILEQIREGIADSVSTISGLAGGTPGAKGPQEDAEDSLITDREESTSAAIGGVVDQVEGVVDNLIAIKNNIQTSAASQAPEFYLSMPIPWAPGKNLTLQSNETMDAWMSLARQIIMSYAFFIAVCETIVILRKSFV